MILSVCCYFEKSFYSGIASHFAVFQFLKMLPVFRAVGKQWNEFTVISVAHIFYMLVYLML